MKLCSRLLIIVTFSLSAWLGLAQAQSHIDLAELSSMAVLDKLEQGQILPAERLAKKLTEQHPNFRLGHLLYADIQSIKQGLAPSSIQLASKTEFNLSNLRSEANRRRHHRLYPPPLGSLPSAIVKLSPDQAHVVVNDLDKGRMYIFKNELGEPKLIADHYVGIGKAGFGKEYEGDHRTPLGVYRTTGFIPDEKLPDLYGAGAYPLNYPNTWDRLKQRTGYGIWIHGVPAAHYNRPPLSSEGCITMNNQAFNTLADISLSQAVTVLNVNELSWLAPGQWNQKQSNFLKTLARWEQDWESLNTEAYLNHYDESFTSGSKDYSLWKQHKQRVNRFKSFIDIELSKVSMFEYGGEAGVIQVNFTQRYRSDNLKGTSDKSQLWKHTKKGWKIIYEGALI